MSMRIIVIFALLCMAGCASRPKVTDFNPSNACSIMDASERWREAFVQTYEKYGVPPHLVMAFIYQESSFKANARPPMKSFSGVPTGRASTAFGYPQAKDETWAWYMEKTGQTGVKRNRLPDAVDFIGWYVLKNHQRSGVSKWETGEQYFAYHDGMGGYERGTHLNKSWLIAVADKVQRNASKYRQQLATCFSY